MHNPGALEIWVGTDQQCYTTRIVRRAPKLGFYWLVVTLGMAAPPILLYITWRKQLAVLQQVKVTKGGPAVMWAYIAWMPLANLYFTAKMFISTSHYNTRKQWQIDNMTYISAGVAFNLVCSSIAAVIQSGKLCLGCQTPGYSRVPLLEEWLNSTHGAILTYFWLVC